MALTGQRFVDLSVFDPGAEEGVQVVMAMEFLRHAGAFCEDIFDGFIEAFMGTVRHLS